MIFRQLSGFVRRRQGRYAHHEKTPPRDPRRGFNFQPLKWPMLGLALTGLKAALGLVDHVNAAFAAHDAAIPVPVLQRAERVANFHRSSPVCRGAGQRLRLRAARLRASEFMVGDTRFELVTPSMSTKCSTTELITHEYRHLHSTLNNIKARVHASVWRSIKGVGQRIKGF